MSQTERIFFIDKRIHTAGKVTLKEIAGRFEVSARQVKRDIEYLRERLNAPVVYSRRNKGYIYETEFRDLAFADQSRMMSYVILKSLSSDDRHYLPVYSDELLRQVEQNIPKEYLEVCDHINYQFPQAGIINPDHFTAICEAVKNRQCLEIQYCNLKNEVSERVVEPEQLINNDGSWYMVCFDRKHERIRTFNISRIEKLSLSSESFSHHTKQYEKELKEMIASSFGIFKGAEVTSVTILFKDTAARIVASQQWHKDQKSIRRRDGSLELTFPVAEFTEVLGKVLSFGVMAEPLKPKKFVDLWRDEVKKMAAVAAVSND